MAARLFYVLLPARYSFKLITKERDHGNQKHSPCHIHSALILFGQLKTVLSNRNNNGNHVKQSDIIVVSKAIKTTHVLMLFQYTVNNIIISIQYKFCPMNGT